MRHLLLTLALAPILIHTAQAATHTATQLTPITALLLPDRTLALLVVLALFYFGFKWRVR